MPPRKARSGYTALELSTWRGLLQTHAHMRERLGSALEEECGLSISEFEVLIMVNGAEPGSIRMAELCEQVLLTPSGLSRLVDRLERRGLVARVRDDEGDGRSMRVSATDEGRELFAIASQAHVSRVRTLFLTKLTPQEMETLSNVWAKICD